LPEGLLSGSQFNFSKLTMRQEIRIIKIKDYKNAEKAEL
jgi:hypothetical protein